LWLAACPALPATENVVEPEFLFRSWDSEAGLPAARIQALAETEDGYLWVATSRGLARFDGARFVVLTTNNTPQLGDNRISCLLVAGSGDLWVGTEGGFLARRRGDVFEPIPLKARAHRTRINSLAEEWGGGLWIGAGGSGVGRWSQGSCKWFSPGNTNNIADSDVTQVITDKTGRPWAIAGQSLVTFKDGAWQLLPVADPAGAPLEVVAVAPAMDGGVWVATCPAQELRGRGTQLFKVNDTVWTEQLGPYPWRQDSVFTRTAHLMEDRAGRLWVGTIGAGMFVWSAGTGWQPLANSGHPSLVECSSMAEGKGGTLWVGTTDFLLFQVRNRPVSVLALPEAARQNVVLTACARRDGSVWVGTDGKGAYSYREGEFHEVGLAQTAGNLHVGVFYEDRRTNFWMGTWAGLHRLEGEHFQSVTDSPALSSVVLALCEDRRSNLWVGTGAGVVCLGQSGARLFAQQQGIDHFYIRAIEEDRDGQIWVAITDRGLYRKAGERFEHYGAGQWSGEDRIRGLHADAEGALWMTTDSKGLARLKDGRFTEWTSEDGLPTDNLVAVTEDAQGNLWFSSANGIFGCPKSRLNDYQRGVSPPILFWQLSAAEGLDARRCSGAGQPAVAHSSDRRLWFPNWHALAVFDPVQLQRTVAIGALPPLLEETLVDGVVQAPGPDGTLHVKSTARSFEFHYTSPTLDAPERLAFRYRLLGWEPDWVEAGQRRVAYYSHLPVGSYQFQVMAGGPDGVWHEAGQELKLEVVPQVWERRWVQGLGGMGLLGAVAISVWSISRAKMRRRLAALERQRALEQERSRIARDMHDEIGARLTQISLLSALADGSAGDAAEVRTQAGKISGVARGLTRSLDEIVWAVRPQNDNLESLVDYLDESMRDLCEGSPVRYWFSGPALVPAVEVSANLRHNVLLAASEVVNNTLKHSGASEVRVNVRFEAETLRIEIADNGNGFDVAKGEAKRSGLVHIRQRLEEIGGSCVCQSVAGEGTRFSFMVPVPVIAAGTGEPQGRGRRG
jgi:ligand-binding sensor domain-containing protein/signal transduction histidine kinase